MTAKNKPTYELFCKGIMNKSRKGVRFDADGNVIVEPKAEFGSDVEVDGKITINGASDIVDKSLTSADAGKVLTVKEDGTIDWQTKGVGGGMKAFFDAGGKCGESNAPSFDGVIRFNDTSDLTDVSKLFYYCENLTSIPLIDTSKATIARYMFWYCSELTNVPSLDFSNVTDAAGMFFHCENLTSIPSIDTGKVTNMNNMFASCSKLTTIPLLNTSKVTDMSYMFASCSKLTTIPALDVSNVTNMEEMLYRCQNLTAVSILNIGSSLDISASTKFTREALVEIIGNLKTVSVTKTLTMGSTNLAKLTDDDKAIATNKGWTLK